MEYWVCIIRKQEENNLTDNVMEINYIYNCFTGPYITKMHQGHVWKIRPLAFTVHKNHFIDSKFDSLFF